ncbi:MAG: CvpA family protein [Desulfobacterales bacterium]|nr:CvpA family protein [Desulfobacterales bacterium]
MNPFDIITIVILAFTLIRGIFRGLIKEVSSIVGVVGGYYIAYTYYADISKLISKWMPDQSYINLVSFLLLFCVMFISVSLVGVLINYLLNIAFLGWLNRLLGAGFGFIKGALIISIIFVGLTTFLKNDSPLIKDSMLAPYVSMISDKIVTVVPEDMKNKFMDKLKDFRKNWENQK